MPLSVRLCQLQSHFRVEVRSETLGAVLTLFGELDLASTSALEQELGKVAGSRLVVADLRQLEFIDSTGLSVLVKADQRAHAGGTEFAVVRGRGQVQRLMTLTGVDSRLRSADTPEELLNRA